MQTMHNGSCYFERNEKIQQSRVFPFTTSSYHIWFFEGKIYLEICHRRMSSNLSISMVVAPASAPLAAKESNTIHGSHTYFSSILFRQMPKADTPIDRLQTLDSRLQTVTRHSSIDEQKDFRTLPYWHFQGQEPRGCSCFPNANPPFILEDDIYSLTLKQFLVDSWPTSHILFRFGPLDVLFELILPSWHRICQSQRVKVSESKCKTQKCLRRTFLRCAAKHLLANATMS